MSPTPERVPYIKNKRTILGKSWWINYKETVKDLKQCSLEKKILNNAVGMNNAEKHTVWLLWNSTQGSVGSRLQAMFRWHIHGFKMAIYIAYYVCVCMAVCCMYAHNVHECNTANLFSNQVGGVMFQSITERMWWSNMQKV